MQQRDSRSIMGALPRPSLVLLALLVVSLMPSAARAQLGGLNLGADYGLKSGSQAPPGVYATYALYHYDVDKVVLEREFDIDDFSQTFHALAVAIVTNKTLWGANYGFGVTFPWASVAIQAPRVDLAGDFIGYTDMWVQPISLGWHMERADLTTWYAFYVPTGEFEPEGDENTGLGMWAHELALGTTLYLDQARTWNAATLASLEFHSEKKDTDTTAGTVLTLEGGMGKTLVQVVDVGLVYYLQWKVTDDEGLDLPDFVDTVGKNRNFGLGAEASLLIPLSSDFKRLLIGNVRYVIETGTELDTQGDILTLAITLKAF